MKKKLATLLAVLFAAGALFSFAACDGENGAGNSGNNGAQIGGSDGSDDGEDSGDSGDGGSDSFKFPTEASDPTAPLSVMLLANSAEREFYSAYFAEMAEKYNIAITFESYGTWDYYSRLDALIQQGNTPDIFYVRPNEILQYKECIYCLDQFKYALGNSESPFTNTDLNKLKLSDIYSLALDLYKYNDETNKMDVNGELYAFPKDLSTQQLGYNKTLISRYADEIHAAQLALPWEMNFEEETYTWEDYHRMCEIIATEAADDYQQIYATDIPDIEILAKSFGGDMLNTSTMQVSSLTSGAMKEAIDYQKSLVTGRNGYQPAADFENATQANFQAGRVAFYSAVGSWEVGAYDNDRSIGKGNWDVMPWPTKDGTPDGWQGKISSAGYVVSNKCKNWQAAMEIAASFMTAKVQHTMVREAKISLPMNKTLTDAYLDPENDDVYSPSTRSVFIDVISKAHGFVPSQYYTFKNTWQYPLYDQLEYMWSGRDYTIDATTRNTMQSILDSYQGQY